MKESIEDRVKRATGQDGKFKVGQKVKVVYLPNSMRHFYVPKTYAVVVFTNGMHPLMNGPTCMYTLWFPENGNESSWYDNENLELYND